MARKLREIHITGLLFKKNGGGLMTNETALSMLLPTEHVRRFLEEASRDPNFAEKFPKITTQFQRQILWLFFMGYTVKNVSNYLHVKEGDLVSEFNKAIRSITVHFLFSENIHRHANRVPIIEYIDEIDENNLNNKNYVSRIPPPPPPFAYISSDMRDLRRELRRELLWKELNEHSNKKSSAVFIDDKSSQSDMENINVGLTFTEEAMNDLNRVAENAVRKAREHNDEIEHLLGQLQALREESSK
jgi:hypothetical protein